MSAWEQVRTRVGPLAEANFRWFWLGDGISSLGNQFFFVALPWTILKLTNGSSVALGTFLMCVGIPRLLLMLLGGALSDRFSPRLLLMASNVAYALLCAGMAAVVFLKAPPIGLLYVLAFGFGLTDIFFFPALNAIIPRIVDKERLQTANAWQQSTNLVAGAVGPGLAGFAIAIIHEAGAFVVDGLSFAAAFVTLLFVRIAPVRAAAEADAAQPAPRRAIWSEIHEGVSYVRSSRMLSTVLLFTALINFLATGTMHVGPSKLVVDRFPEGAAALGILSSAGGIGALIGVVLAGRYKPRHFMTVVFGGFALSGLILIALGLTTTVPAAACCAVLYGLVNGFIDLLYLTWIQRAVAPELMGRVMSLVILAGSGAWPISDALAGFLAQNNVSILFGLAGTAMVLVSLVPLLRRDIRTMTT